MKYDYKPKGVCSRGIHFDLEGDIVRNIRFDKGCDGNLKAIAKILDGWSVADIESKCSGNTCERKPTSCADQLAKAVRAAYEEQQRTK